MNGYQQVRAIKLLTAAGRLIKNIEPVADIDLMEIDLSDLPPGLYLIQVKFQEGSELLKVLKK